MLLSTNDDDDDDSLSKLLVSSPLSQAPIGPVFSSSALFPAAVSTDVLLLLLSFIPASPSDVVTLLRVRLLLLMLF